ncbi:hypothetical protein JK386_02145 [Nocardioides sp. zg-536]|uniref:Uncharacterized protein n=1 Tax=Nocardioides faecalis TaxID=2803858 RepID=A0A938Y5M2_9ACTN|nr:hypothetical protein [Nocardioides faecalis]MBM9458693.1 hypothetical protein [Nocardioides faecalis]MBS4753027.1 hypothetical protein [Nocardioides faecalis]QVI58683.1 hypothetical protein KG111_17240 [Nocardioides faecalis]
MAFDYFELSEQFDKIEEKLGYLKGNELAWDYLVAAREQLGGFAAPGDDYMPSDWWLEDCKFPVPGHEVDPSRWFQFRFWVPRDTILNHDNPAELGAANAQYMKDVAKGAIEAWHNGASWASGLASYCRQITDSFTRADATTICSALEDLHTYVTSDFSVNVLDDPFGIETIRTQWTGRSGTSFNTFYANYDGQIAQMAWAGVQVAQTFAAAAHVIHGTQQGVLEFAKSIVKIIDDQLDAWAPAGPPPRDAPEEPAWVADVTKVVTSGWKVLGHIPVVKDVKSQFDAVITAGTDVTNFAKTIADVTGTDLPTIKKTLDAADSDEIYTLLTETLYDDYQQKYVAAMDALQTGSPIDPEDSGYSPPINTSDVLDDMPPPWFPREDMPNEESLR